MQTYRGVTTLAFCVAFSFGAHAAPVTNKTIEIEWVSQGVGRQPGSSKTESWNVVHRGTIYISTAGRAFMRYAGQDRALGGKAKTFEFGPGRSSSSAELRFVGNTLVGTQVQPSGAIRMVVSFDPGFTSCNLQMSYARSAGKQMQATGPGGTYEIDSIQIVRPSCQIAPGNGL